MAKTTHFFLGANSGSGFQNLFPEILPLEDTYDLMILKGGPGVGKNTFMREVGKTLEAGRGRTVEYLWCSGDPDSLDGVVIPAIHCGMLRRHQPPRHGAPVPGGGGSVCGFGAVLRPARRQGRRRRTSRRHTRDLSRRPTPGRTAA